MAEIAELERALVNADAAGDASAARTLANEIIRLRGQPDKYQQAALDERATLEAKGIDTGAGYTRRLAHGATLGADNTILAGLMAPIEAVTRGVGLGEGYSYAKAREDALMNESRAKTGLLGSGVEMLGGGVAGGGLAQGGLTAARYLSSSPSLLGRTGAMAADAAGLGAVTGFNEGNGLRDRLEGAGHGLAVGGLIGGALPIAGTAVKAAVSPFIANIMAQINPRGYAERQVARAISESGRPAADIANDVVTAANEGQGVYTLADAMGNPGQRLLSTVARAPGQGRTATVDFLEGRQGTQGRRVSNALAEGFDTPQTAAQTEARMTGARDAAADAEYGAVRSDAKPVDLTATIAKIDETLQPGVNKIVNPGSNIADDTAEAALRKIRDRLTDDKSTLTDFAAIQRLRGEIADERQALLQAGKGNRARLLKGVLRELDDALENASAGHKAANAKFAQSSRDIEAVQRGREAATRGRTEDTIPAYQALSPEGQAGFRAGYSDPLIANTQGAAFGANKARPLLNDAFADEAAAMAPGNRLMQRRLTREQRMFETRNQAMGNSKTAENLADDAAMAVDPTLVGHVLSGNWSGAARSLISAGQNVLTGNTPAVRSAVAEILLQRGANVSPARLDAMVSQTIRKLEAVQRLAQNGGRVTAGAIASAVQQGKKRTKSERIFGAE